MRACNIAALVAATLLSFACRGVNADTTSTAERILFDRANFKITYVAYDEKRTRSRGAADLEDMTLPGASGAMIEPKDTLQVQCGCRVASESDDENVHPQQAFLRFVRLPVGDSCEFQQDSEGEDDDESSNICIDTDDTRMAPPNDAVYVMHQRSVGMRIDLDISKEMRVDPTFWSIDGEYRVEVIVGDQRMEKGVTWVAIERMRFSQNTASKQAFVNRDRAAESKKGIFDFDVGVKKSLLPEYQPEKPGDLPEAPFVITVLALIALITPLPVVMVSWSRLGVWPLQMPPASSHKERVASVAFEVCLLGHGVILGMFWLRWNIVQMWKACAMLLVPTVLAGHSALAPGASRFAQRRHKDVAKTA